MEGLLIAEQLRVLVDALPAERLPWRFPDDRTAVLPLVGQKAITLVSRPPAPSMQIANEAGVGAAPRTPFQEQLRARAGGALLEVNQPQLDRVVRMRFAGEDGFVPTAPVELVAELTGRNANLVLLDEAGLILGVERQVLAERNRYRELKVGLPYVPPPPYDKVDPLSAPEEQLLSAITGKRSGQLRSVIDGVGPRLGGALRTAILDKSGLDEEQLEETALTGELAALSVSLLQELAAKPSAFLAQYGSGSAAGVSARGRQREKRMATLTSSLERRLKLAKRRVDDARRAIAGAEDASRLRSEGDLLLAYANQLQSAAAEATLTGFGGETVKLKLDPRWDAAGNANARYDQARRREARADRAAGQLRELEAAVAELQEQLANVPTLTDAELAAETDDAEGANRKEGKPRNLPGIRFQGPHGFEVVVGRNSRDNDKVTFEVGRSRDVWLHAQGYRGSHVIIRSGGKEVPFETVLFAARLAAGYSDAFRSDNVPVDYTARKHVWKVKGGAPGAVNYTQQRTVFVTPARDDAGAAGA